MIQNSKYETFVASFINGHKSEYGIEVGVSFKFITKEFSTVTVASLYF